MKLNSSIFKILVIGNEKGGAGKTTCSMHIISGLLDLGYQVISLDIDSRQHSLTTYINNRKSYNLKNPSYPLRTSKHYHISVSAPTRQLQEQQEEKELLEIIHYARNNADYLIIDTPGSHTFLSTLAHSYANIIITPINDSFLDIDVLAKIDPNNFNVITLSIYSEMIWEQKIKRAARDQTSIEWFIIRNRLSNLDAINKRNIDKVLTQLTKRLGFKVAPGFGERVNFRELFLQGLTLYDLNKGPNSKSLNISHIAARRELRSFFNCLNIDVKQEVLIN